MPWNHREPAAERLFLWEGRNRHGHRIRGETRAGGATHVQAALRRQGVAVTRIRARRFEFGPRLRQQDLPVFTRQLAALIRAGVPLLQSLELMARGQAGTALARVLHRLCSEVATGQTLSGAMSRHPELFPSMYRKLVAVGESAGTLESTLDRLAVHEEKVLSLRRQVRTALTYPAFVAAAAAVVVAVIMVVVVPTFHSVFASFGATLPPLTRAVMEVSEVFVAWGWWMAAGVVSAAVLVRAAVVRSNALRYCLDTTMLRLPLVGDLLGKVLVARWTRTLTTLIGAGVPLVQALGKVAGVAGNQVFGRATQQIQRDVSTGRRLALSMDGTGLFPPMVVQMTAIGEEAGSLDAMLSKTADFFEAEVDEWVKRLSGLIEPIIVVLLGVLVGGIVLALYLPIFQLGSIV